MYQVFLSKKNEDFGISYDKAFMECVPSLSIDVAVMEKSAVVSLVPAAFSWTDLGSFDAISTISHDVSLDMDVSSLQYSVNSNNNKVFSYKPKRSYSFIGLDDIIAVDTPDTLMLVKSNCSEQVKDLTQLIKNKVPEQFSDPDEPIRPWGYFEVLHDSENYKLKHIHVSPGKRLSLQKHSHRSEHWVVVKGEAYVEVDDKMYTLQVGESVDIPKGAVHRLSNQGEAVLTILESQFGDYLGEDDIVRLEDDYSRV